MVDRSAALQRDLDALEQGSSSFFASAKTFAAEVAKLPAEAAGAVGLVLVTSGDLLKVTGGTLGVIEKVVAAEAAVMFLVEKVAEGNKYLADKIESAASYVTGINPDTITFKMDGEIAKPALALAQEIRKKLKTINKDDFAIVKFGKERYNNFWNAYASCIENLGKVADLAANLAYSATLAGRVGAHLGERFAKVTHTLMQGLDCMLQGIKSVIDWTGDTLKAVGKHIDYGHQMEDLSTRVTSILKSTGFSLIKMIAFGNSPAEPGVR